MSVGAVVLLRPNVHGIAPRAEAEDRGYQWQFPRPEADCLQQSSPGTCQAKTILNGNCLS